MHRNLAAAESIALVPNPEQQLDRELRILNDTKTWLAETLHGSMRTRIEYNYDGQILICEDGGSADEMFDQSITEARVMTEWNPSMSFELRRRLEERAELNDMYDMISGDKPNTMVVISDFPEEIKPQDPDSDNEGIGGYNPERQQTMMRTIFWDAETQTMTVQTQSLDGSNREALEAIYESLGYQAEEGELLGQRMHLDLPEQWRGNLVNNLTSVYDQSMTEQFGGEWYAGISQRPDKNIVNTYEFVEAQTELLEWFTAKKLADPVGAEKLRYGLAATAKAMHEAMLKSLNEDDNEGNDKSRALVVNPAKLVSTQSIARGMSLETQIRFFEKKSAAAGDTFDGCGMSITAEQSVEGGAESDNSSASGYRRGSRGWSKYESDDDCEFVSKNCPECKTKNVKTKVTKTHISGDCGCTVKRK